MQSRFVSLKNLRLHLMDWGSAPHPPLLLLHGLASSCHMFDLIGEGFTRRYHVYAPDQRGHGLTDKPANGYDFETIAGDIDELLAALDIQAPVALVGHSWGAYTTLYYAATRPRKVAKAVLLDGGIARLADHFPTWEDAERGMSPPTYHERTIEDIEHMIQADWLGAAFRPELLPLALSIFDTSNPRDVRAHLPRQQHMQIARALWEFNPAHFYPRVTCPTLIVNAVMGDAPSEETERYTRQAQEQIAHCQIAWMLHTIHDIPWHRPLEISQLIKSFLESA